MFSLIKREICEYKLTENVSNFKMTYFIDTTIMIDERKGWRLEVVNGRDDRQLFKNDIVFWIQ